MNWHAGTSVPSSALVGRPHRPGGSAAVEGDSERRVSGTVGMMETGVGLARLSREDSPWLFSRRLCLAPWCEFDEWHRHWPPCDC